MRNGRLVVSGEALRESPKVNPFKVSVLFRIVAVL